MIRVPAILLIARQISYKNIQMKKTITIMKEASPLQVSVYYCV
jgi:hypothetical protein